MKLAIVILFAVLFIVAIVAEIRNLRQIRARARAEAYILKRLAEQETEKFSEATRTELKKINQDLDGAEKRLREELRDKARGFAERI